ncbi:MAG: esterase [Betaproteobacteria bacterium]|nr:esterase [Betaproteobacteria bacterium]
MQEQVTHVLYLHGFRSSPLSAKAQSMGRQLAAVAPGMTWWCPQLSPSPAQAMQLLLDGVNTWPANRMAVVGSSLGGFYATFIAERLGCKAVVLNPAIHAARDLTRAIGEHSLWHTPGERFYFKPDYVDELSALEVNAISQPDRYYVVIAKGDEVLDWREMSAHYPGCKGVTQEGGDHAISNFEEHLPGILRFLDLRT